MNDPATKCPLWNVDCEEIRPIDGGLTHWIDSSRAGGDYVIGFDLMNQLSNGIYCLTDAQKAAVTTWLDKERKRLGDSPGPGKLVRLTNEIVEQAQNDELIPLSPDVRIRRMLRSIAALVPRGDWLPKARVTGSNRVLADTESISRNDAELLIDELISRQYVVECDGNVRVTLEGHTEATTKTPPEGAAE